MSIDTNRCSIIDTGAGIGTGMEKGMNLVIHISTCMGTLDVKWHRPGHRGRHIHKHGLGHRLEQGIAKHITCKHFWRHAI